MKVVNDRFKIKKTSNNYLTTIRNFLRKNGISSIRYYITDVKKNYIVLEVSYYAK